ncbi:MAG: preprotein translocase subunit YajC [Alphaproteobacteria bacterium]|jgi:preprotein translocase subunit YajC|nr:preprotein translocase subunit YajC [Rhodospirillaceae bacterium]MDP6406857.1 preprotein translocase subunit YajC [Alphaproteobacteria bacterium]MDP6622669.1 preprotein translocase subunit YajC [Alphaproteobacteria bacterium]|tara:strand:+ start:980 stop:1408 length:429 start_codon:yes stop_codon:yes gene_type:complete
MFISPAYAQAAGGGGGGFDITAIMPLILIFAVFYFLLIRPQQKKAKEHRAMIGAVRRGDTVVTGGGLIGKVIKVNENDRLIVEFGEADNKIKMEVVGSTLTTVVAKTDPTAANAAAGAAASSTQSQPSGGLLGMLFGRKKPD